MKKKLGILIFILVVSLFGGIIHNSLFIIQKVWAATNINSIDHWAWNDTIGWIDFYTTDKVNVSSQVLSGYANSAVGYIALDCATTPNDNVCGGPAGNWKVINNGEGNLSGWAWNDAIGWISFDSASGGSSYFYQVTIGATTGVFSGWAWNDNIGWISFNCENHTGCGASNYKVKTNWQAAPRTGNLISSVYDTQVLGGAGINTIIWQGSQPAGTIVKFQIASSNCSNGATDPPGCTTGTWSYIGPDGTSNTHYGPINRNSPVKINPRYHSNHRYFRYKLFLETNLSQTQTPRVDDVILGWSP